MSMKWENDGFKSNMACARGLGAAHHGTGHWMHQRMTAFASIFLTLWLIFSLKHLIVMGADFHQVTLWLRTGLNPVFMILFVLAAFYHGLLGLQVILEDYIHAEGRKVVLIALAKLLFVFLGTLCVFCVLKVALAP